MRTVIRLEGIGKKYWLRHQNVARYNALRDVVGATIRGFGSRFFKHERQKRISKEDFWALKDIFLDIRQGERIGIIGRNGAGKSTLLKLLSRITAPTQGRILIQGRVGSLLEVGTGFHPELTGRENIFLNGAILGMRKTEIKKKFAAIVDFAEIEHFLDTPVKRYSSGMYVRLAFSIAAHMDPDILLVDEVLAVGDAAFQKKCLGKMGEISKQERTILFVSHNMLAVKTLCTRALWLVNGRIQGADQVNVIIDKYLSKSVEHLPKTIDMEHCHRPPEAAGTDMKVVRVHIHSSLEHACITSGTTLSIDMEARVSQTVHEVCVGFSVFSLDGVRLFQCHNVNEGKPFPALQPGMYRINGTIEKIQLPPGRYQLDIGIRCDRKGLDWLRDLIFFEVSEVVAVESTWFKPQDGIFLQPSKWNVDKLS